MMVGVAFGWLRGFSAFVALGHARRLVSFLERHANPFTADFRRCAACSATVLDVAEHGHRFLVEQHIEGSAVPWPTTVRADQLAQLEGRFQARACPNACDCEPQCFTSMEHIQRVEERQRLAEVP